eukprot:6806428-Pyramimonas_sp.AAC.1
MANSKSTAGSALPGGAAPWTSARVSRMRSRIRGSTGRSGTRARLLTGVGLLRLRSTMMRRLTPPS